LAPFITPGSISIAAGEMGSAAGGGAGLTKGMAVGISAGAGVAGGATAGELTNVALRSNPEVPNANQFRQSIAPNSQTLAYHIPNEVDWIDRLKDAAGAGPGPNLLQQNLSPNGMPPTPGMGFECVPALQIGLFVNPGFAISQSVFYNAKGAKTEEKGRTGRQNKLKEIAGNSNIPKWIRGFINNFFKQKGYYKLPGNEPRGGGNAYELAHRHGYEASKSYNYAFSELQSKDLHDLQHSVERDYYRG